MVEQIVGFCCTFWPQSSAYFVFIVAGAWWLRRPALQQLRETHPQRYRLSLATYLAFVFTPSLIGDLWLIAVPGPALMGFLIILSGILLNIFTDPAGMLQYAYGTAVLHLVPLIVGTAAAYGVLFACSRCRVRHVARTI